MSGHDEAEQLGWWCLRIITYVYVAIGMAGLLAEDEVEIITDSHINGSTLLLTP